MDIAAQDPSALLIFSGGETRPAAGPRSEAQSYWMVAELSKWWQHDVDDTAGGGQWSVRSRTSTEEFARDSYENLLFSICRFHELTQRYPEAVTVVGFTFKRDRFVQLHAPAIRYPPSQLSYAGLDPTSQHNQSALLEAEMANSYRPFVLDPYGCFPASVHQTTTAQSVPTLARLWPFVIMPGTRALVAPLRPRPVRRARIAMAMTADSVHHACIVRHQLNTFICW